MKRISLCFITLALLIIVLTVSCSKLKGAAVSPAVPAAAINLTDHNGQPFQLSNQRGKVVLVFFGLSHCATECPTTMAIIRQALATLGNPAKEVVVVMVSTDPDGDTPQSMKEFMGRFNPAFLGLLGRPEELAKTWQAYGVAIEGGGETHSRFTYVVDKKGDLRETFPTTDTSSDDIAADLKVLLAEK